MARSLEVLILDAIGLLDISRHRFSTEDNKLIYQIIMELENYLDQNKLLIESAKGVSQAEGTLENTKKPVFTLKEKKLSIEELQAQILALSARVAALESRNLGYPVPQTFPDWPIVRPYPYSPYHPKPGEVTC